MGGTKQKFIASEVFFSLGTTGLATLKAIHKLFCISDGC